MRLVAILCLVSCSAMTAVALPMGARAELVRATLAVSVNVTNACSIATDTLSFGRFRAKPGANAASNVTVDCPRGVDYSVGLKPIGTATDSGVGSPVVSSGNGIAKTVAVFGQVASAAASVPDGNPMMVTLTY